MNDSKIIDELGGTRRLAKLFKITEPSVTNWRINGIPEARKQTLAELFPQFVPKDWRVNK
jgi:hypothetical protein